MNALAHNGDMQEALSLAATHGISAHIETEPLEEIDNVFDRLRNGKIQGRVVLDFVQKTTELVGAGEAASVA